MSRHFKYEVYWMLTRWRDWLPFFSVPIDWLRYEVFYPYDDMEMDV